MIDDELVYLDGNSLGRLPRATVDRLQRVVAEQWGRRLIRAWDEGWLELPIEIGDRLGAAALGAAPGQTIVADSTTVCFYKLACAALDLRPGRNQIVTDYDNFPTDRYVLEGLARSPRSGACFLARRSFLRSDARRRAQPCRRPDGPRDVLARLLPLGPHRRHGADLRDRARRRRADAVGPQPQRRLGARAARRRRRRPRRRLHLQVPERRPRRARVHVRPRRPAGAAQPADLGLARPPQPLRDGARLRPRDRRHRAAVGHAAGARA